MLCPQGSRGALPAIPQEGKTNMILTYFAHGPSCLRSLFYQPPLPHSLALFLLASAASLPLPTPLRSPYCPVDGCLRPLEKGFVASFSTSEKLRAGCPVLPSPDRIVLLRSLAVWQGTETGLRRRHGRVCQLLEKTEVSRPLRMVSKLSPRTCCGSFRGELSGGG